MKAGGIDASRIESMLAQLKAAAQRPNTEAMGSTASASGIANPLKAQESTKTSFSDALKSSLDQVNQSQQVAEKMGKRFASGDDSVSLSDVMIAGQKASISFQATVQVRNKLVNAYQDIMNMSV